MKNLHIKNILSIILIALFSTSVGFAQQVYTDEKETADLSDYQTYEWVFNKEIIPENQVLIDGDMVLFYNNVNQNKMAKDAIETQMDARGFTHDPQNPDMLVNFRIFEKPTELRTYRLSNEQDYLGFGPRSMTTKMVPVEPGTILIDFLDAETGHNIWQGFASGVFEEADLRNMSNLEAKVISIFNDWNFDRFTN
ncbi:hypothetical protein GCM10009119_27650 [Algoriphagus jejuensis]|uniref:DUF4136 domain-containing protein n=1 Tax=Algoriphagus jejuensis TaxID=419934 RepID=A0ABP3YEN3_9BACT